MNIFQEIGPQTDLYNEAYYQDYYDTLIFSGVLPPLIIEWFESINSMVARPTGMTLEYKKLEFEHTEIYDSFSDAGWVFQPGGHKFEWSDLFERTRCYIFGPVVNVFSTNWIHHLHGGAEPSLTAPESWAGWGRLEYYEGRLWQMGFVGYSNPNPQYTDLLTGAKNGVYQQPALNVD